MLSQTAAAVDPPAIVIGPDGETAAVFDYAGAIRERVFVPVAGVDQDNDGVDDRTAVDIVRPAGTTSGLKVPAIIVASPYFTSVGRHSQFLHTTAGVPDLFPEFYDNYFVPRGYAVLLAEANGTGFSTGCPLHGGPGDVASIAAVIDWLQGRVPGFDANGDPVVANWDNGKAGLIGKSYDGTFANGVAATGIDGLTTIVPLSAISDWYRYSRTNGIRHNTHYPASLSDAITRNEPASVLGDLPTNRNVLCDPTRDQMSLEDGDATGDRNAFWDARNYVAGVPNVHAAVFASAGLNDDNVRSDQFALWWAGLAANNVPRKLWLSQEGHVDPFDYRRAAWVDTLHRWFDFWLYAIPNGIMSEPRVTIERSADVFEDEADWPPPGTSDVDVFLRATAAGAAGTLADVSGGSVNSLAFTDLLSQTENAMIGNPTGSQANRLVFLSPVLTQDVRLSGTATLRLRAALSTVGGNLGVLLVDYSALSFSRPNLGGNDGVFTIAGSTCWGDSTALDSACYSNLEKRAVPVTSWEVAKGILDTRNRDSLYTPSDLVPHNDYDFTIPMLPTDYVFGAGHQVGVIVVSSYRPYASIVDPNRPVVTMDTHLSRIALPIVGGTAAATSAGLFTDLTAPTLHLPGATTAEATGVTTTVNYTATASDDRDANPSLACTPATGTAFPLGRTTVNCTATDASGNAANGSFDVTVADTTAPALQLPTTIVVVAGSSTGAPVTYTTAATDTVDPHPTVSCLPASGSTFPVAATTVHCIAMDTQGNVANGAFQVIVAPPPPAPIPAPAAASITDTTAPSLQLPAPTAEATSPGGATVTYAVTVSDNVDTHPTLACAPASGSVFAVGRTTVRCTATDASGNAANGSFDVTVADTTAPTLNLPAPIDVDAAARSGAVVRYRLTVSDAADASPDVACTPASGSRYAVGTTRVRCTATDAAGNIGRGSFLVHVDGAADQLRDLLAAAKNTALAARIKAIQAATAAGQKATACRDLRAFVRTARTKSAAPLRAQARRIAALLGC